MDPIRFMIVDDEILARERLRSLLPAYIPMTLVGEYDNGPDAIVAILRERPDLVFLDVQMPGCDGLQVVSELAVSQRPAIVFVTAHEKFAVEAFSVEAVDYLLKPFDAARLKAAVQRAANYIRAKKGGEPVASGDGAGGAPKPGLAKTDRLTVKVDGRVVFLQLSELVWLEAADNYVILHLVSGERLMIRETLSALEERLQGANFERVNRSAIVQMDHVKELQPTLHGDYSVVLRDGTRLPLSRGLRGSFARFVRELS